MKKNYEDLQKIIDALNSKLQKVKLEASEMKNHLIMEDMEKANEVKNTVDDKIYLCDQDINASKSVLGDSSKPLAISLVAKKKEIISEINKMVNTFNDNNKVIKDINKSVKSEREMNELITKN